MKMLNNVNIHKISIFIYILEFKLLLISIVLIDTANLTDVTYYEILGISKQASSQEIRQAYKKLAVKLHPDKNSNAEQEKFLKITEAYETLKDADKRRNYDLYGSQNSYTRKYDYHSQSEYNKLYYNGLYHDDPFVDTLSGGKFYNYLQEGFHFINFYSPFCPPCQNLVDHWKKLAERYKGIVKVAAVNCKHYNSFCYNSMRIGSYPSLLFYPNGKNGNFIYYRGDRTVEALDQFVMNYLKTQVHVPTVTQIRNTNQPIAYVLGVNRIESNSLTRIAYHLKGLVTLTIVEEHSLRTKLTTDEQTTVVFKYKGISKEIHETEEKDILKQIVDALPKIELIEPEKLKKIRNELRSGDETPWVLYFSSKNQDRLRLHQLSIAYPDMNFGEIDCDKWGHLCESLQVPTESTPAWGVLKAGGAYQRAPASLDIRAHLRTAASATRLHSLSASEFQRILDGGEGTWVLVVVPHQSAWDHIAEPFTRTGLHFSHNDDISFGIMTCTLSTDKHCRSVSPNGPAILMQRGAQRHAFSERVNEQSLIQFVELLRDSADLEITEQQVLEILDVSGREHSWLVAFLPDCGPPCTALLHECRKVAHKLKPLEFVRVGVLRCSRQSSGFCRNVRFPTMRLYPIASGHHYTVNLQNLAQAPYILEWALEYIDDSVQKLNWKVFSKTVIAEELHPKSDKKPWLVYFHSPRCYRCYEMFPDFAIAGILLNNAVNLGKVNCLNERGLCQHEQVTSYPSLKLYLGNNLRHKFSSVISLQVKDYASLLQQIKPHLMQYDERLLAGVDELGLRQGFHMKHDEF